MDEKPSFATCFRPRTHVIRPRNRDFHPLPPTLSVPRLAPDRSTRPASPYATQNARPAALRFGRRPTLPAATAAESRAEPTRSGEFFPDGRPSSIRNGHFRFPDRWTAEVRREYSSETRPNCRPEFREIEKNNSSPFEIRLNAKCLVSYLRRR